MSIQMLIPLLVALCSTGCDPAPRAAPPAGTGVCRIVESARALPRAVRETSGIAVSSQDAAVLWTHNDRGHEPLLYAVGADGRLRTRTVVTGARLVDWEDVESGECDGVRCLYIADIGDNSSSRESITIYEVPEPAADAAATAPARPLHARYPDGPHNAEALFAMPGGDLYIVTKGDRGRVSVYRYPASARADSMVTLEHVRQLRLPAAGDRELVTAANASPDGAWIAIRTYTMLHFFAATELLGDGNAEALTFDLRPLGEAQGEGVAFGSDGTVWLSSEADGDVPPQLARLLCTLLRQS
ncbi:MAG TPA: hypothetical protein VFZ69_14820 [Longimicrobiales bacterium]